MVTLSIWEWSHARVFAVRNVDSGKCSSCEYSQSGLRSDLTWTESKRKALKAILHPP